VNDTLDHSVGDQLLKLVAQRVQSALREEDTVARLSGDEFTVIVADLPDLNSIELIAEKLMLAFQQPLFVGQHEFDQGISVGISVYPRDGDDAESLMKNADAAMYRAKDKGRQGYQYYLPSLTDSALESRVYPTQLKNAIENDEFILHYQPIVCLQKNCVMGFEALIRW
jgi:predicted signal transduction protein with EAL and GGDEF domain